MHMSMTDGYVQDWWMGKIDGHEYRLLVRCNSEGVVMDMISNQ